MKARLGTATFLLVSCSWCLAGECEPQFRSLREPLLLDHFGPEGIAFDPVDNSLWLTFAVSRRIQHFDSDFRLIGEFVAAFDDDPDEVPFTDSVLGITIDTGRNTLLLMRSVKQEIWEFTREGKPTGEVIELDLPRAPLSTNADPVPRGIAFDPHGDLGAGSIWVVEGLMTAVYEVDRFGKILRSFCHPDDPDGCPGDGSAARGSDLVLNHEGEMLVSIDLASGFGIRDQLVRVDPEGEVTGLRFFLQEVGGEIAGVERGLHRDPDSGELREAYFVVVSSSGEIHVVELTEPQALPVVELDCPRLEDAESSYRVTLEWRNTDSYEGILVRREGEEIASLAGDATSHTDLSPPDGLVEYEVVQNIEGCELRQSCSRLVGAGVVLAEQSIDGLRTVDIAEDHEGFLWVTVAVPENRIQIYDKDLQMWADLESPFFMEMDALTSGIAFNSRDRTFFVYDATTNRVAEIDLVGKRTDRKIFPSGLPDGSLVTAMLFDPQGDGGAGSFWYVDTATGTLEQRSFGGELLGRCVHPDQASEPPPPTTDLTHFIAGATTVPGHGFDFIEVTGGTIREGSVTRILRLDTVTCRQTADEVPVDEIRERRLPFLLGLHRTMKEGREVMYVVNSRSSSSHLMEVDAGPPPVGHVVDISCRQPTAEHHVEIRFIAAAGVDEVRIERDGAFLATVAGGDTSYLDRNAPAGFHTYRLRAVRDGQWSDDRECALQVGPGSVSDHEITHPVSFVQQVAYDPAEDVYLVSSTGRFELSRFVHVFDRELLKVREFESPFQRPREIAAMALRAGPGGSELYCLGWTPAAASGDDGEFTVRVVDTKGNRLRELTITLPLPRIFVVFPSGMAWDPRSDTLWVLERNSRTLLEVNIEGEVLRELAHPASPHQDRVQNFGLAVDPRTSTLYLSSAGRLDRQINKLVEITRRGELTGFEIPLGNGFYTRSHGFTINAKGDGFLVASRKGGVFELVDYRAHDPLEPVGNLECVRGPSRIDLSWTNGEPYDSLDIYRGQRLVATLDSSASTWSDEEAPTCEAFYRVVGRSGDFLSPGVVCDVGAERPFLRGDVEENGDVNITDAIRILAFLFTGGEKPVCLDAADTDDDGKINITDAIRLLNYLFLPIGGPPPAPFPDPGCDPTEDGLGCGA